MQDNNNNEITLEKIWQYLQEHMVTKKEHAQLSGKVDVINEEVGRLREDVTVLKADVSVLKEDVGILKEDMADIKPRVGHLQNQMVTKEYLDKKTAIILAESGARLMRHAEKDKTFRQKLVDIFRSKTFPSEEGVRQLEDLAKQ
ncbi:hypothetical protein HQ571_01020 [Candidatus Kuenenbacteria bacterium]|nr:hypothetical protein [Candidatus Kuenenbacteria bacterium]